jgi:hypothetical protein
VVVLLISGGFAHDFWVRENDPVATARALSVLNSVHVSIMQIQISIRH